MKQQVVVLLGAVLLLSGCSALRPLPEPVRSPHRHLTGVDSVNWGNFECSGLEDIGFSTNYKALDVPSHGVVMGQVKIHNRGLQPFEFRTPGFRLTGAGGFMDSAMKCPENQVPAGGVMQCGFVAPAISDLKFDSFQPFFVPRTSAFPCFCQQPYELEPFVDFDDSPVRSFADAVAEAFGAPTLTETLHKLDYWQGNALGLAEDIVNSLFSSIGNTRFELSANLGGNNLEIFAGAPRRSQAPDATAADAPKQATADTGSAADKPASGSSSAPGASSSDNTHPEEKRPDAPTPTATGKDAATTAPTKQPADIPASNTPISSPASAPASTPAPAKATPTPTTAPAAGTPVSQSAPASTPVVNTPPKTPTQTPTPVNAPLKTPVQTPAPSSSTPAAAPIQGPDSKTAPVAPSTQPKAAEPTPAVKATTPVPADSTKPGDKAPSTPAPVADTGSSTASKAVAPKDQQPAAAAPVVNKPTTTAGPSTPAPQSKEPAAKEQPAATAPVANKPTTTAGPSTPAPESKGPAAAKPDSATSTAPKQAPAASGPVATDNKAPASQAPQPMSGPQKA